MKQDPAERVYEEAVKPLSAAEKLWLIERIIRELRQQAGRPDQPAPAPLGGDTVVGLWSEEADTVDDMVERLMQEREQRPLRGDRGQGAA